MDLVRWAKAKFHQTIGEPAPGSNLQLRNDPDVVHVGRRAFCRIAQTDGEPHVRKIFTTETAGRRAFANERLAYRRYRQMPWFTPWKAYGLNWFEMPKYQDCARLDRAAASLSDAKRLSVAGDALSIVLDLLAHGHAHRDFHAGNLFLVDGQLKLIDFEGLTPYVGGLPGLAHCYDVTGEGLESPWHTGNMAYSKDHPSSIANVLKVDFSTARAQLSSVLRKELREASLTFQRTNVRHTCKHGRIYNTLDLPGLTVGRDEAQRDCRQRFDRFGITTDMLKGKRVLDLGSNIGGMLLEARKHGPSEGLGIEYDAQKVIVSNRTALFADITDIRFEQGDIDKLTVKSVRGPYDIVFCLAVVEHLKNPQRMYRLLGDVTRGAVYFEGNSNTKVQDVEASLHAVGFTRVENLGMCDDDSLAENNCRPIVRAFK